MLPADILRCPQCGNPLESGGESSFQCPDCETSFPFEDGIYDFSPGLAPQAGFGQRVMESPLGVAVYENYLRVSFVRIMAQNWNGVFTPEAEDEYLVRQISPVEGPVLDLACGAGRWTRTIVETFGGERVIGLDLSRTMLERTAKILPEIALLRGDALHLPFANASLGAVNCSNALQLFPNPEKAIAEVGRCLKPGGTFTFFAYRKSSSSTYRLLQGFWEKLNRVRAFREEELRDWLTAAGMQITDLSGPGLAILGTASPGENHG